MLQDLRRRYERLLEWLVIALMAVLFFEVTLGVVYRTVGASLPWYDEVASILLAWLTYRFIEKPLRSGKGGKNIAVCLAICLVSLGLIAHGVAAGVRGTTYIGAFGLIAFIAQVGLDLDDDSPAGHAVGWPLVLLLLGGVALAGSVLPALRRRT